MHLRRSHRRSYWKWTWEENLAKRVLPGQRVGAKAWFDFFTEYLTEELNYMFSAECPRLGRNEKSILWIRVDDWVFTGCPKYTNEICLPTPARAKLRSLAMSSTSWGESANIDGSNQVTTSSRTPSALPSGVSSLQLHQQLCLSNLLGLLLVHVLHRAISHKHSGPFPSSPQSSSLTSSATGDSSSSTWWRSSPAPNWPWLSCLHRLGPELLHRALFLKQLKGFPWSWRRWWWSQWR